MWSNVIKGHLCSDVWLSGVKTLEEENTEGVDYFGPVKTIHKDVLISTLEK